jgi:putative transposase
VKANRASYPIATMCRVLGVSTQGYYAWRKRPPSVRAQVDAVLTEQIRAIHEESEGTYGVPRIKPDLAAEGYRVSGKRIARLMKAEGLAGISGREGHRTTWRDPDAQAAPDLVDRNFTADGPDQLWVADITYVPTCVGFLYLAIVLDVWSRRVVGWAMETHLRTDLVLGALNMAILQRQPEQVIHHSDQGCQYTSTDFRNRCTETGIRPSMGSVGDCYDNAMCESFFATVERELLSRYRFQTQADARKALFRYIEGWYNTRRRHSSIQYESPVSFETEHETKHKSAA